MWQSLLRSWLMKTAQEKMFEAAAQHASGAAGSRAGGGPADPSRGASPGQGDSAHSEPRKPQVCHAGLVFALGMEADGLVEQLSGKVSYEGHGFTAKEGALAGRQIVVVESGPGKAAAAQATRALILGHKPRLVISAGFAGGLDARAARGVIVMASGLVDETGRRWSLDLNMPAEGSRGLVVGTLLTADRIIAAPAEKKTLGEKFAAVAVDMESTAVADVCREERVPLLCIRVITDGVDDELPPDLDHVLNSKTTAGKIGAAAGAVFRRPSSVKDFWQLKEQALVASQRLGKFLAGVIGQLEIADREKPESNKSGDQP